MECGTLCNVTSGGQSALSMIAAAACDGGKEDSKELCRFPTIAGRGKIQEVAQVGSIVRRVLALRKSNYVIYHAHLESIYRPILEIWSRGTSGANL